MCIDDTIISTIAHIQQYIPQARKQGMKVLHFYFSTLHNHALHPKAGVPQLTFDQLNIIAKHLTDLKHDTVHSLESEPKLQSWHWMSSNTLI